MAEADKLRQVEIDFQTVRFHGLHTQRLLNGGSAHLETSHPKTSLIADIGRHSEAIDAIHGLAAHLLGIKPTRGIGDFKHDRIIVGQLVVQVVEHQIDLNLIARTPHATISVGKARNTLLNRFAIHIETAVRQRIAITQLDNRLATFAVFGHHKCWTVGALQLHMAFRIGCALRQFLTLEVVGLHLRT